MDRPAAPLPVSAAQDVAWDDEADVVVVGFGGAGASAALEAAERGARVVALDRFDGGGATAYSGGVVYAGATSIQRAAGVSDDIDEMAKYLALEVGDAVSPETVRRFCVESGPNLEWLIGLGAPFKATLYSDKTIYPPEGYFLYYSGNEKVPEYKARAVPAARGHRTVGTGMSGYALFAALRAAATARGIMLRDHSPATRLITDADGRVIGVEARELPPASKTRRRLLYTRVAPMKPFNSMPAERASKQARALEREGTLRRIRARKGVVLATGGFSYNVEMLARHLPFFARNVRALMRMGSMGCDGSGIELGISAGGAARGLDRFYAGRNMSPPPSFLEGILVNREGRRFVNEMAYTGMVGRAIAHQTEGAAWLILDHEAYRKAIRQAIGLGWAVFRYFGLPALINILVGGTKRARTIDGLASKCGIEPGALRSTVQTYNQTVSDRLPDVFGKLDDYRRKISGSRYYALNYAIPNIFAFTQFFTLGGLDVDERTGAVLRADGTAIPGLYAAGRAAFGLSSNNYISGLSLGDCVFSGRRAARAAMTSKEEPAMALEPTGGIHAQA